jgi:hexosaminidase
MWLLDVDCYFAQVGVNDPQGKGRLSAVKRDVVKSALFLVGTLAMTGALEVRGAAEDGTLIRRNYDGLQCEVSRPELLQLSLDGIPLMASPSFYVVNRDWTRRLYGLEDDGDCLARRQVEETSTSIRIVYPLKSSGGEFAGRLIYELSKGPRFCVRLEGKLNTTGDGCVEHRMGRFAPGWFAGQGWKAVRQDGSTTGGVAPITPVSPILAKSTLVERFRDLQVSSLPGLLRFRSEGNFRFSFVDYRLNQYNEGELCYWLGVLGTVIKPNTPFEYSLEMTFDRQPRPVVSQTQVTTRPAARVPEVLGPETTPDRILPTPRHLVWGPATVRLADRIPVTVEAEGGAEDASQGLALVQNILSPHCKSFGLELAATEGKASAAPFLRVVMTKGSPAEDRSRPDWYRLRVGKDGAHLEAHTTGGLRAGLATLIQLFRAGEDGTSLRECEVEDYAAMPVRAVHFFSGRDARELQIAMLRNVLLPLKYNMIIYECEYIEWESLPQIRDARYSMKKADAAAVIEEAHRLGFEVVPLINTFGHCEWLLDNDAFRHLADNPAMPYAYDPSNPDVYRLCERVYAEALDLFRPRYFHIGHDEVTMRGFPLKEANRKRGAAELFWEDTMHYYKWLRDRGVKTMMWGDQLLAPGEGKGATLAHSKADAEKLRRRLPKDIVIADWHYDSAPPEKFVSLRVLTSAGFDVLACTWCDPMNIVQFAKAAAMERARVDGAKGSRGEVLGLMQTTWAGYSFDKLSFERNIDQYAAYVLAGEAAWRGGARDLKEVKFDYHHEFVRLWTRDLLPPGKGQGWSLDLTPCANLPLVGTEEYLPIAGGASLSSFETLKPGLQKAGRWYVNWPGRDGKPAACLFYGQFNPPGTWLGELRTPIERPARTLFFVVASTVAGPKRQPVATTIVEYEDGTTVTIDWCPGVNVFGLEDGREAPLSTIVWRGEEPGKGPRYIHGYVWQNPYPAKTIKALVTKSTRAGGGLLLFGVSGLE